MKRKTTVDFFLSKGLKSKFQNYLENIKSGTFLLFGKSKKLKISLIQEIGLNKAEYIFLIDDDIIPLEKVKYVLNYVRLSSDSLRIVVIDIDNVNIYSLNAMLKTLEEPPSNCIFILLKSDTNVIPTILSRSIKIFVNVDIGKLVEYLIKFCGYSLNWAEFVVYFSEQNFDIIDYFNHNLWNLKEKKPGKVFEKLLNFLFNPSIEIVFEEDFWVKIFGSFISYRALMLLIKSFLRDVYYLGIINKTYDPDFAKYLEKNLIFLKIIGREEFFNKVMRFRIVDYKLYQLLNFIKDINIGNIHIYKRVNKKILYVSLIYNLYVLLGGDI
ncbi:MAG: hypothetical protein ACK4GJ_00085 [bacterium]